jgi:hypothetical protein
MQETSDTYVVPDHPADPEAAALELIVRMPEAVMRDAGAREILQELTAMLEVEGTFTGMSWFDAKHAAVAIVVDALERDDAHTFLLARAERARNGSDGMRWDDPTAMARALTIGAKLMAL